MAVADGERKPSACRKFIRRRQGLTLLEMPFSGLSIPFSMRCCVLLSSCVVTSRHASGAGGVGLVDKLYCA